MKCLFAAILASTALVAPYHRAVAFHSNNINTRYQIERVTLEGERLPMPLAVRRGLQLLTGQPFEPTALERLEGQIREACPGYEVRREVTRGAQPGQLNVRYVLERAARQVSFTSPRFLYHSQQDLSFGAGVEVHSGRYTGAATVFTENDQFLERATGVRATLRRGRFALLGETMRSDWATAHPDFYTGRTRIEPTYTLDLAPHVTLTTGLSFNHFSAAGATTAHAFINSLRYRKQMPLGLAGTQTLEAGYHLRAATTYQRQLAEANLELASGARTKLRLRAQAGHLRGEAPVFERFLAGNSQLLRGWNRLDLAPLGASRLAHLSVDGRHRWVRFFYDSGTVWQAARPKVLRHAAGFGFTTGAFSAMIAFPIRSGPVEPVFLLGMNF